MRAVGRGIAAAMMAVLVTAPAGAAVPSAELFGSLPETISVDVSPDGRHLATLQTAASGERVVLIYPLTGNVLGRPRGVRFNDLSVDWVEFANDSRVLAGYSGNERIFGAREYLDLGRTVSFDVNGGDLRTLFRGERITTRNASLSTILDMTPNSPDDVLMPAFERGTPRLFRVDVNTGRETRIESGTQDTVWWLTAAGGKPLVRIDRDAVAGTSSILVKQGERWTVLRGPEAEAAAPVPMALGPNGDYAYVATSSGPGGRTAVRRMNLADGTVGDLFFEHAEVDIDRVVRHTYTGAVVGYAYVDHRPVVTYTDPEFRKIQAGLKAALGADLAIRIVGYDRGLNLIAVHVEGDENPGTFLLYDRKQGQASPIAEAYPRIPGAAIGRVRPLPYAARDGTKIPAYLTLPPGVTTPRGLPAVVLVHGGPAARDYIGFDFMAQFLASRGYAVLQPNYRGSSGYGIAFERAGWGEWGGRMQDDVTDGVRHLIAEGIADPKRICIAGASYGGYAALAGATLTPELYTCAVSISGVTDLVEMLEREKRYYGGDESRAYQYWIRNIGDPETQAEKLIAASPARQAGRAVAPVLLIHGKEDSVVPIAQSRMMADALESAGKQVRFVTLSGEDHFLSRAETRIATLKAMEEFLAAHLN